MKNPFALFPNLSVCLVFLFWLSASQSHADNWPQWRGEKLDNVSQESNLPGEISLEKNLAWKLELPGPAGASPVVWEDKIFLTSSVGSSNGDPLCLICVSTEGKQLWKTTLKGTNRKSRDSGNGASPSPFTDGKHVWAMTTNGFVQCFDMAGKLVWTKDLQSDYGKFNIQFGMTSTPILDDGNIYLQLIHGEMKRGSRDTSVGWVIALKADSGDEIWKHKRETDGIMENRHSYASPAIYRDGKNEFLVSHGGDYVIGHSLKDGSEIFRCGDMNPKGAGYNMYLRFVASPVCAKNMLVVPTAKNGPVLSLDIESGLSGDITEKSGTRHWRMDRGTPDVSTPVVYDGGVYLARENGVVIRVDAETGEETYQKRMMADKHRSTPIAADGKLYLTGRDGRLVVLEAGDEPKVLSRVELGEETLASPAISNGVVYVRTFEALYAFRSKP